MTDCAPRAGWRSGSCSVGYPDVAISLNELALLYDRQGRYADAALTVENTENEFDL
jgi:hypothetical protein